MFFHLAFRIRKLGIGMFNHRHDRRLFRFLPIYTIVTQVIGSNREGDFLAKAVHESTGFTDIGKIIRQERILSELVGRNISVLRGNLATELAGTVPDAFQFRIIKRRIALGCFVQKFLTGFIRHTETLDQSARNTGQGAVALPFWNAAVRFHQCQPVLDSQTPFVPNHLTFRAKQKTGGIQRIAVKEGKFLVDTGFDCFVKCCILAGRCREKYMETRAGGYRAFRQHMMTTVCDRKCHIC